MKAMPVVASGQITLVDLNDAKSLLGYIGSNSAKTQIFNPLDGVHTPNWVTTNVVLTPELFVSGVPTNIIAQAKTIVWYEDGVPIVSGTGGYTIGATNPKALTIAQNKLSDANPNILYTCEIVWTDTDVASDITVKTSIDFGRVKNGAPSVAAVLSNESHAIPTDSAGNNFVLGGATSTLTIYEGGTDVTASWAITQALSNVTVTASGTPANRTATILTIGADTATVTFTATRSGYSNIVRVFTINKNKGGVAGTTPTAYWMSTSAHAIQKTITGVTTPATLTVTGYSQLGTGTPASTAVFKFVTDTSTDGSTYTNNVASPTGAVASTTFTTSFANLKAVRFRLYRSVDTPSVTNFIDEQIVLVVSDGATGAPAITADVWTPDGNAIKNATGTAKARVDVYSGGNIVAGTAFKWYAQDGTATTVSGGDADGGNGWRLINAGYTQGGITNYTTAEITIPAISVTGSESFKCVVTYNSIKYTGVCTIVDLSDPIQVVVVGTNTFKNGTGSTVLTAKLYQTGVEIDAAGSIYTYTWSLYDSAGVKDTTALGGDGTHVGKSVTVDASDVNVRGNILCEVSKP